MKVVQKNKFYKIKNSGELIKVLNYDTNTRTALVKDSEGVIKWIDEAVEKVSWVIRLWIKIRGLFVASPDSKI